jgi:hypothetical protein
VIAAHTKSGFVVLSARNSDANAALYWLARMTESGAHPILVARRPCILAWEDVGLADPQAMVQAPGAAEVTHFIGLPEALFRLGHARKPVRVKTPPRTRDNSNQNRALQDAACGQPVALRSCHGCAACGAAPGFPQRTRRPCDIRSAHDRGWSCWNRKRCSQAPYDCFRGPG